MILNSHKILILIDQKNHLGHGSERANERVNARASDTVGIYPFGKCSICLLLPPQSSSSQSSNERMTLTMTKFDTQHTHTHASLPMIS